MELKNLNYIFLDFETTGLNIEKDIPIQIGISKFDKNGHFIDKYSSLIKPEKNIENLKSIVEFLTQIDINNLNNAPNIEQVNQEILKFFNDKNTVIIGHNINFDIGFLNKFFKGINFLRSVDTYKLAVSLLPFAPSYSLEILTQYLYNSQDKFKQLYNKIIGNFNGQNAHDALYDTLTSAILFFFLMENLFQLSEKYPILPEIIQKSEFNFLFNFTEKTSFDSQTKDFKIPLFLNNKAGQAVPKKNNEGNRYGKIGLKEKEIYYMQYFDIDRIKSISQGENIILSFSHKQKLDLIKKKLEDQNIKFSFLKYDKYFTKSKVQKFFSKENFSIPEALFAIKYFKQVDGNFQTFDIQTKEEKNIIDVISEEKLFFDSNILLSTHKTLFKFLENGKIKNYKILFFDVKHRYNLYNQTKNIEINLLNYLEFLENLKYKLKLQKELGIEKSDDMIRKIEKITNDFTLFTGLIFIESKKFFVENNREEIELSELKNLREFYYSFQKYEELKKNLGIIKIKNLSKYDREKLEEIKKNLEKMFSNEKIILKRKFSKIDEQLYFIFQIPYIFTSRDEFLDIFEGNKVYFISNIDENLPNINLVEKKKINYKILKTEKIDTILEIIKNNTANLTAIISFKKSYSQEIFDRFIKEGLDRHYLIIAENITGGRGKSIFQTKNHNGKAIVIGGFNFLLQFVSNEIFFDQFIGYHITDGGAAIIKDLLRYNNFKNY